MMQAMLAEIEDEAAQLQRRLAEHAPGAAHVRARTTGAMPS